MKRKSVLSFSLVMILLLQLLTPLTPVFAASVVPSDQVDVDANFIITTNSGSTISPSSLGKYENIPLDAKLKISYAVDLKDDNGLDDTDPLYEEYDYHEGDIYKVSLDANLINVVGFTPLVNDPVYLDGHEGDTAYLFGLLNVTANGVATVTFSDYVDTHSALSFWFEMEGSFKDSMIGGGNPTEIDFSFEGSTIRIGFDVPDPADIDLTLQKDGEYDNATGEIEWKITVTPPPGVTVPGVSVSDVYSQNQTYVNGSFNVNGTNVPDTDTALDIDSGTRTLLYSFPDSIIGSQEIIYRTKPDAGAFAEEDGSPAKVVFKNTASVKIGSVDKGQAVKTVELDWIDKEGTVFPDKTIHWTVVVNKNDNNGDSHTISNAIFTDLIPNGLDLVADSVKVQIGSSTSANVLPGDYGYVVDGTGHKLTYQFTGDLTGPATITYITQVVGDTYYNSNEKKSFENTAELNFDGNVYGNPSDTDKVYVGTHVIHKTSGGTTNYDYNNNIINWTIVVNDNRITIDDAVVEDFIPAGMELINGSVKLKIGSGGESLVSQGSTAGTYSYITNSAGSTFSYQFSGTLTERAVIKLQTKVADLSQFPSLYTNGTVSFPNNVTLSGIGLLSNQPASATQKYNSQVIDKSLLSPYDYATRRMEWQVAVNRNHLPMNTAVITDTIPEGLILIDDSVKIKVGSGSAQSVTSGSAVGQYTYESGPSGTHVLTYRFTGELTDQAILTFTTEVMEDQLLSPGDKVFVNQAKLTANEITASGVIDTASSTVQNPIIEKNAEYDTGSDYVKWIVPINSNKVFLQSATISDNLQSGLQLDDSSVTLYRVELQQDGSLANPQLVAQTEYSFTYDQSSNNFELTLPENTNDAYQLEFITDILVSSLNINNTITFSGSGVTSTQSQKNMIVQVDSASAGGAGANGKIVIKKIDDETGASLMGAKFRLSDSRNSTVAELTTGADGKVSFENLRFKRYFIQEITAPSGYLLSTEIKSFRLSNQDGSREADYTFTDQKALGELIFYKQDTAGNPLAGAEFTLYNSSGASIGTAMSIGPDGKVKFDNLEPGSYTVKETAPPAGFRSSDEILAGKVSISGDGTAMVTSVTPDIVINERISGGGGSNPLGKILVNKINEDGKPLSGAALSLVNENGKTIQTVISDSQGHIRFNLVPFGDYTIKETSAPEGYLLSGDIIRVSLDSTSLLTFTYENKRIGEPVSTSGGEILIQKIDENSDPLAGAVFTLCDASGSAISTQTSKDDGIIRFSELAPGNYSVKETKAPAGYELVSDSLDITIGSGETYRYTFKNIPSEMITSDAEVPLGWITVDDPIIPEAPIASEKLPQSGAPVDFLVLIAIGTALVLLGLALKLRYRRPEDNK